MCLCCYASPSPPAPQACCALLPCLAGLGPHAVLACGVWGCSGSNFRLPYPVAACLPSPLVPLCRTWRLDAFLFFFPQRALPPSAPISWLGTLWPHPAAPPQSQSKKHMQPTDRSVSRPPMGTPNLSAWGVGIPTSQHPHSRLRTPLRRPGLPSWPLTCHFPFRQEGSSKVTLGSTALRAMPELPTAGFLTGRSPHTLICPPPPRPLTGSSW